MLLRRIITSTFCFSLVVAQLSMIPVTANQGNNGKTNQSNEAKTARAIRIGFIDGIIQYINNSARTRIKLEWEPLPVDKNIVKAARKYGYKPVKITIRNEDLENNKWITKISEEQRRTLEEALESPNLETLSTSSSFWDLKNQEVINLLKTSSLGPVDYLGLIRDRNVLVTLLESNGISYSLEIPKSEFIRISDKKINWNISVYKFVIQQKPEIAFYRFGVKAVVDPFEISISDTSSEKKIQLKLEAGISFKQSDKLIGLSDNARDFVFKFPKKVDLDKTTEGLIDKLKTNNAPNELEGFLTFFGGSGKLGEVISKGLLGGTKNTSIVSGGIIDFEGGEISPLIGVNSKIANFGNTSAGILFGAGLDEKTSLFLGPSLQASIFTLSAGGLAVEGNKNPQIRPAGLISVDLSRLTRSQKVNKTLKIENTELGGNWGQVSEKLFENLTLIEWKFTSDKGSSTNFKLRQVCNSQGVAIKEEQQTVLDINASNQRVIKFIPKGIYKYEIPSKFQLLGGDSTSIGLINPNTASLKMTEDNFKSIIWKARINNQENQSNSQESQENNFCNTNLPSKT